MKAFAIAFFITFFCFLSFGSSIWSEGFEVPEGGRSNVLNLSEAEFKERVLKGQIHTQKYPISVTGVLLPERPLKELLDNTNSLNPFRVFINEIF